MRSGVMALVLVAAVSCGSGGESSEIRHARYACEEFHRMAGDAIDGVLTWSEQRARLQEVERWSLTAAPGLRHPAREMLRAWTQEDSEGFDRAVLHMTAACDLALPER